MNDWLFYKEHAKVSAVANIPDIIGKAAETVPLAVTAVVNILQRK